MISQSSTAFGRIPHPAPIIELNTVIADTDTKSAGVCMRQETSLNHGRKNSGIISSRIT
jgi:hypothetical protein